MNINEESLKKLAHLARLDFDASASEKMAKDLSGILDWVEQLNEVDTEGVKPLTNMSQEINAYRQDVVGNHLEREKGLKNAPDQDGEFFRVPKVLD
ncbi:Asp-tRNA(Asn)/Glu-tRNA(Gln) amidotransferase subunit GatC [Persicobacter diffluens]|uniref:Aspartyl/glutamyl-tRNA(Asn/Gln) amidotransferase subunit C n=1 Tax=Persicobacter diffluens TaxID=981 RepID=A0AAN4VUG0_9BACT|nr:aspartyl/glutamyl-tRNA(Asn/Gln) amidotransferase subunit C [Persicobacter diffluens]